MARVLAPTSYAPEAAESTSKAVQSDAKPSTEDSQAKPAASMVAETKRSGRAPKVRVRGQGSGLGPPRGPRRSPTRSPGSPTHRMPAPGDPGTAPERQRLALQLLFAPWFPVPGDCRQTLELCVGAEAHDGP